MLEDSLKTVFSLSKVHVNTPLYFTIIKHHYKKVFGMFYSHQSEKLLCSFHLHSLLISLCIVVF